MKTTNSFKKNSYSIAADMFEISIYYIHTVGNSTHFITRKIWSESKLSEVLSGCQIKKYIISV